MTDNQCIAIIAAILLAGELASEGAVISLAGLQHNPKLQQESAQQALTTALVIWDELQGGRLDR